VLGPVEPQAWQAPAAFILNVPGWKEPKGVDDHTPICADGARKAIAQEVDVSSPAAGWMMTSCG
jgi:Serine dehydrogenase proteinase